MKPNSPPAKSLFSWLGLLFIAFLVAAVALVLIFHLDSDRKPVSAAEKFPASVAGASRLPAAPSANAKVSVPNPSSAPRALKFRNHPLRVSRESGAHQWTVGDGKDPGIIGEIAHNESEFTRMVNENDAIYRRQLVYRKETAAALIQRAKLSGESVRQLTLPGLDGQELIFEITKSDLNASGQQGAFAGRVAGRPDSIVTLAFKGGREAFTVVSPTDGIFLQADPREPGEIIVKSINPDKYAAAACGTP